MKKIILLILVSIAITFAIYKIEKNDKIYYMVIGDSIPYGITPYETTSYSYTYYVKEYITDQKKLKKYDTEYVFKSLRTTELLQMLKYENKKNNIKQKLVKADLITLSIGMEDILYKLNTSKKLNDEVIKYIDEVFNDIEECIKIIRKYNHKSIYLVGLYNPYILIDMENPIIFDQIEQKYKLLSKNYDLKYIEINHILGGDTNYIPNPDDFHLNYRGQKIIGDLIISKLKEEKM